MIMLSQEIPDVHTVARVTPLWPHPFTSIRTVTHPVSFLCLEIRPSPDRMKLLDGGGGGVYWGWVIRTSQLWTASWTQDGRTAGCLV